MIIDQLDTDGLIFHVPLNDGFGLSNQINGIAMTNAGSTATLGRYGETGGARAFVGESSNYIDTNFDTIFTNSSFTMCGWIKGTNVAYLAAKTRVASPYSSEFIFGATGATNFNLFFLRGTVMAALSDYRDNLWHFLAIVYDISTKKFKGYLDMVYQGESVVVADYTASTGNVIIGSRGDKTTTFADGSISDMMIYNKIKGVNDLETLYRRVA